MFTDQWQTHTYTQSWINKTHICGSFGRKDGRAKRIEGKKRFQLQQAQLWILACFSLRPVQSRAPNVGPKDHILAPLTILQG